MMIKARYYQLYTILFSILISFTTTGQTTSTHADQLYTDVKGMLRWKSTGAAAAFFGVNYTVPFAYGYRSHKALGIDPQQAIDNDVYHLARLGINAFRVHVWDTEISDATGKLINNEHLRLFDYLLARLEERGIYILITPIAFWGNGYPEKDEQTGSFSNVYGKEQSVVNEKAIAAQERYLTQFFKHINPYTKKSYGSDPYVVATELNNEPKHSGTMALATSYINRLNTAVRNTGWTKPVFYNISESPAYAAAVAASHVDGFSFQWYPTGLVAGHEQKGNFLPNVDRYHIPFDTIPAFLHKPRIIYEFDAADILQSYLYPAMARSFRSAGFQWATQFAYDPMATAYGNTEYQTHYLNLAYTPSKAISLLIAGQVFRNTPLHTSYGSYPADTAFAGFRLSYKENLSEMNTAGAFYYSNSTSSKPVKAAALKHVAGVGSSPLVEYAGTGAYFLDQLPNGSWRLEVMPDADKISDPFATASADKAVNKIVWRQHQMKITLPQLQPGYSVKGLNKNNSLQLKAKGRAFVVSPGTYLLSNTSATGSNAVAKVGMLKLDEFVAPQTVVLKHPLQAQAATPISVNLAAAAQVILFDAAHPPVNINFYLGEWNKNSYAYLPATAQQKAVLEIRHGEDQTRKQGMEIYIGDVLSEVKNLSVYHTLVISATADHTLPLDISLLSSSALAYGYRAVTGNQEIRISLSALKPVPLLLLPRPYPGFQPLYFNSAAPGAFKLSNIEKLQLIYEIPSKSSETIRIHSIRLE